MNLLFVRTAALALALPLLGVSAAIQINGSCYGPGSCTNPANPTDSVTNGGPVNGSFNQNITVGTDLYQVSGTYTASYNGTSEHLLVIPTVTYLGTTPAATNDSITINYFQDIYDPTPGPFSASTQTENIPLVIPVDATGSGQLFFNGTALPLVGPYGPGTYDGVNTASFGPVTGDYLAYDYQFVFDFSAGLPPGSSGGSPAPPSSAPEPAMVIPAALALVGFGIWRRRENRVCTTGAKLV